MTTKTTPRGLRLSVLTHAYAIGKWPATARLPSWIAPHMSNSSHRNDSHNDDHDTTGHNSIRNSIISVTRTGDELSIVCPQDLIDHAMNNNNNNNNNTDSPDDTTHDIPLPSSIERNWACLMVQGPLDLSLVGILASLANPLAQAGISMFAVSTYNTDYLLVKQHDLVAALQVLQQQGHAIGMERTTPQQLLHHHDGDDAEKSKNMNPVTQQPEAVSSAGPHPPNDGPATTFEADAHLISLLERHPRTRLDDDEDDDANDSNKKDTTFGLLIVAGWPPDRHQLLVPYKSFRAAVELCFNEPDVGSTALLLSSSSSSSPAVYLYPFPVLHVTVATLVSFHHHGTNDDVVDDVDDPTKRISPDEQDQLTEQWRRVVEIAMQHASWPRNRPLQLKLESAQIGTRAGILLWNETTGGLQAMRHCIVAAAAQHEHVQDANSPFSWNADTLSVPAIVHSTFLRFYRVPTTPGWVVQQRFRDAVLPRLREFFPAPIQVSTVSYCRERRPYMHIQNDHRHVYLTMTMSLAQQQQQQHPHSTE